MKNYYYILGVKKDATQDEIKKAYRKLSLKFHPDKNPGDKFFEERFKDIQEAYDILKSPTSRSNYDFDQFQSGKSSHRKYKEKIDPPEILVFTSSKREVAEGDVISITWSTKNADKVKISCFKGDVPSHGTRSVKISRIRDKASIDIVISAKSSTLSKVIKNSITLSNLSYKPSKKESENKISYEKESTNPELSVGEEIILKALGLLAIISVSIFLLFRTNDTNKYQSNERSYYSMPQSPSQSKNYSSSKNEYPENNINNDLVLSPQEHFKEVNELNEESIASTVSNNEITLKDYYRKMRNARKLSDESKDYNGALSEMKKIGNNISEIPDEYKYMRRIDYQTGYYVSQLLLALETADFDEILQPFNYLSTLPPSTEYIAITNSTTNWDNLGFRGSNWQIGYVGPLLDLVKFEFDLQFKLNEIEKIDWYVDFSIKYDSLYIRISESRSGMSYGDVGVEWIFYNGNTSVEEKVDRLNSLMEKLNYGGSANAAFCLYHLSKDNSSFSLPRLQKINLLNYSKERYEKIIKEYYHLSYYEGIISNIENELKLLIN